MDWSDLEAELNLWRSAGRVADFWWRDDDASDLTAPLERLMTLAGDRPVALAVIPALATQSLSRSCTASVLQHGFAHQNHAKTGERAIECGGDRPQSDTLEELRQGFHVLADLFDARFVPSLVPPWNRIDPEIVPHLPEIGLSGLSGVSARSGRLAAKGVSQVNIHAGVVSYRHGTGFAGEQKVLRELVGHLAARRIGSVDANEPTGLLTHHLDHDEAVWSFLAELLDRLDDVPARWRSAAELFH